MTETLPATPANPVRRALRSRLLRPLALAPLMAALSGCEAIVLAPAGDIAMQQRDLLVVSVLLMLIVIVPVMALTVYFAWKYRASNKKVEKDYSPDWDHSTHLELVIWAVPLLIIICLGAVTWAGTHLLDPYRPLDRIDKAQAITADHEVLQVEVVALDWKWLFIYPQYGIATVNELAAPVDRPIRFHITASGVMNSFYIPALAGQIYAMPGMETKLHAVINRPGSYTGFSANYSGDGFSNMRFAFHGMEEGDFDQWVAKVRAGGQGLDRDSYLELERPSEKVPVTYYGGVDDHLFNAIVNMCVQPGKMCMGEMMDIDRKGGLGLDAVKNTLPLVYDKYRRRGQAVFGDGESYVMQVCTPLEAERAAVEANMRRAQTAQALQQADPFNRLTGAALAVPGSKPAPIETSAIKAERVGVQTLPVETASAPVSQS
ncbi:MULTISPECIES: ubiquinol oxidase subunit II [unclassified Brevundimonas]|uniref:ubiquinol oxidase subunit II n=1 Tax=unclassified Brevundimonas TaxID=2622653 RepID=UPI0025BA9C9D|nr:MULTISPECIES: ubiquinol oxidase subunit II [unclassified Brevundimonas]